ncbi:MAG: PIN domain-containing protein [Candidatus Binatia bacterium]
MHPPVAFLDASVLYPAGTRNLLMRMAVARLFHARWSADVHREWMSAVRRDYPDISEFRVRRIRDLMNRHAEGSQVTGYESLIPALELPDPDDRHVLAAAIATRAAVIVTRNLRDFPAERLRAHGIAATHPDSFVLRFVFDRPEDLLVAASEHRRSLRNPGMSADEYLALLERQGLDRTAHALRKHAHRL